MKNRVKLIFAWYDLWIGCFYDQNKRLLYIFPLPMIGIAIYIPFPTWKIRAQRKLSDFKYNRTKRKHLKRLSKKLKLIQWGKGDMWEKTGFCGSYDDAVETLTYKVIQHIGIVEPHSYEREAIKKWIHSRYEEDWILKTRP